MKTVAAALRAATQSLQARSDTDALDAQVLLAEVCGRDRAWLLAHGDRPLTPPQARRFSALVARRAQGEPLAYIRRRQAFFDRDFHVSPAVLIPRPESELLLELALAHAPPDFSGTVAEIGAGSGALGIAFATLRPRARVILTDISPAALTVARVNARRNGVNPTFLQGDLLLPLLARGERVDLLLANLPYVRSEDLPGLEVSRHEPWIALDGGAEGLDLIRRLLRDLPRVCQPGALALLEIGMLQGAEALRLARALRPRQVRVLPDLAGLDRVLYVHL
ncbi:MAG: peptide chain release factor N(5)-glutamine methyltransferase [Anaerolineaceae bacterium]|nr:peptide chain release factor N(5)-glutamine methyltransferase [Anaerolineaceae bacterium]MDE0328933.1 peptide chain release factor N(5)-glutamine methyltransferase [Anaerolineaceae bacterium]